MLAIRMQRTGRKGHAMFRLVVQDSRRTPTSGKIVTQLGSYDPHSKSLTLNKEKAAFYLEHGAQPSDRVTLLLKKEGVKLPKWVATPDKQEGKVRNPDKRRSTRPDEPKADEPAADTPAEEPQAEEAPTEAPAESEEKPAEEASNSEAPTDEKTDEKPESQSDDKAEEKPAEATENEKPKDQESAE